MIGEEMICEIGEIVVEIWEIWVLKSPDYGERIGEDFCF